MNVIDALNNRYTCRTFRADPVDRDTIVKILEVANRSPSWGNTQPWDIYIAAGSVLESIRQKFQANMVQDVAWNTDLPIPQEWPTAQRERYEFLGKARYSMLSKVLEKDSLPQIIEERNLSFFDAPVVLYLCMDRRLTPYSMFDLGAMSQSIMLAAQEYGVATAPAVTLVIYPQVVREAMDIPEEQAIVLGIALGYPDQDDIHNQYRSIRRPAEEMAKFGGF